MNASALHAYLRSHTPGPFRPRPVYSPAGDTLELYFESASARAETLCPGVTIERGTDGRIVGVKIQGVRNLVAQADVDPR